MSEAAAILVGLGKILNPSLLFVSFPALFSHYFLFIIITNNSEEPRGSYRVKNFILCSSHRYKDCYCGYGMPKKG